MGCHISIEPTEKVMPDCSSDDLGNAVIRAIKIAKTPKVDEKALSKYWKQTKYKGYIAFSRHFQAISIRVIGNELKIKDGLLITKDMYQQVMKKLKLYQ